MDKATKPIAAEVAKQYRSRKRFLRFFPKGFQDKKFLSWERGYKWDAHLLWEEQLSKDIYLKLLEEKRYSEIARRAVQIESKTNLLFSFEKMALRDAVKSDKGAKLFAQGLFDFIYGEETFENRFANFTKVLDGLPRKQTRVLTWPLQTVFGFIARPDKFIFLKPKVTKLAADVFGFRFNYESRPNWITYKSLLDFAQQIKKVTKDLKPRDMVDIQSYIWVLGSDEYQ